MSAIDKIAVLAEHHAHVNGSANLPIEYAAILELDERLRRIEEALSHTCASGDPWYGKTPREILGTDWNKPYPMQEEAR